MNNFWGWVFLASTAIVWMLPILYIKLKIATIDREIDRLEGVQRPWWKRIFTMNQR